MKKLCSMVTGLALTLGVLMSSAVAGETFSTLNGIPAEAMSASEMEKVLGKCANGPLAGICSQTFQASLMLAAVPGQSQRILGQFRLANPAIFAPNVFGRSAVSNAYLPYPIYLNSSVARTIQANAFLLTNQIIGTGLQFGVAPYLGWR